MAEVEMIGFSIGAFVLELGEMAWAQVESWLEDGGAEVEAAGAAVVAWVEETHAAVVTWVDEQLRSEAMRDAIWWSALILTTALHVWLAFAVAINPLAVLFLMLMILRTAKGF